MKFYNLTYFRNRHLIKGKILCWIWHLELHFRTFFFVKSTNVPELEGEERVESILAVPGFWNRSLKLAKTDVTLTRMCLTRILLRSSWLAQEVGFPTDHQKVKKGFGWLQALWNQNRTTQGIKSAEFFKDYHYLHTFQIWSVGSPQNGWECQKTQIKHLPYENLVGRPTQLIYISDIYL